MTPLTCWKTAWIPQKHPPERTAVCWLDVEARGASYSGAGTAAAGFALALLAVALKRAPNAIRASPHVRDISDLLRSEQENTRLFDWSRDQEKSFKSHARYKGLRPDTSGPPG